MSNYIRLPAIDERAAPFCAMLLLRHKVTFRSWNDLTGLQAANQCAHDLRELHLPLHAPRYDVSWSKNPVSVYQLKSDFITELGKERIAAYVDAVIKRYTNNPKLIKGLQSKPQPLSAILSGQAINSEVIYE